MFIIVHNFTLELSINVGYVNTGSSLSIKGIKRLE